MQHFNRWIIAVLVITSLHFGGCQSQDGTHHTIHPAKVEQIEGSDLCRVILTEKAMERIGLEISAVRQELVKHSKTRMRDVVPYSAIIYDPQGQTWVYTNPQPRTFIRHKISVDFIMDDMVILVDGPPVGTPIASVGVAELYGTEFGIGH